MYSIKITAANHLDEKWYARLEALLTDVGETFIALMPSVEKLQRAREAFDASNHQDSPELYPDTQNTDKLQIVREQLVGLKWDLLEQETVQEVRDLYDERIEECIANIDMIVTASAGNKEEFLRHNKFVYGSPNYEIFAAATNWIRQDATKNYKHVDEDLREDVLRLVPDIDGNVLLLLPSNEVFQSVKNAHFRAGGYIDQLFADAQVPDGVTITPAIGDPITKKVIRNIGSDFALVDSPDGLWARLPSQKQVFRPSNLALNKRAFMGIVAHEVGSHLLEDVNGGASTLKLLELGLDRYEAGNEGRAFLREQIMYERIDDYIDQPLWFPTKASWEYRIAIHLAISLAVGLYEREHDFAEIYHLLTVLFRFWTAKRGEVIDEAIIHDGAWSMAVRALKGTDGRGGAYLKDIVYLEGNVCCWQAAKQNPDIILHGDAGKFDIANKRHTTSLSQLGILPYSV